MVELAMTWGGLIALYATWRAFTFAVSVVRGMR
jgi:hypothetical protein